MNLLRWNDIPISTYAITIYSSNYARVNNLQFNCIGSRFLYCLYYVAVNRCRCKTSTRTNETRRYDHVVSFFKEGVMFRLFMVIVFILSRINNKSRNPETTESSLSCSFIMPP